MSSSSDVDGFGGRDKMWRERSTDATIHHSPYEPIKFTTSTRRAPHSPPTNDNDRPSSTMTIDTSPLPDREIINMSGTRGLTDNGNDRPCD